MTNDFEFRLKCCEIAKGEVRRAKELYRELYEFVNENNWQTQPPPMPVQEPATPEPSPEPAYYTRNTSNY